MDGRAVRAAILGVGGNGRAIARALDKDPRVESIRLLDHDRRALAAPEKKGHTKPVDMMEARADDVDILAKALRGCDVVAHCTRPRHNVSVMRACIAAGVHYVDLAASGPLRPGEPYGILEQVEMGDAFRSAGISALLSMGLDPGMTNVLARSAAGRLDVIESIRIRSGGVVNLPGFSYFPLYSRDAFLDDILVRPTVWVDGGLQEREPVSGEERFAFPSAVGPQATYFVSHEEVKTLPRFLGKPVGYVDFKFAVDPSLVRSLHRLWHAGELSQDALTQLGDQFTDIRQTVLESFPDLSTSDALIRGTKCVTVEVDGSRGSQRRQIRGDIVFSHEESIRRDGSTAVYYLSGVAAAIGMMLLAEGGHLPPGAFPAEVLPPDVVLGEWGRRGLPVVWSERDLP